MSVVALKNAVVGIISSRKENSPLLTNDNSSSASREFYGTNADLESGRPDPANLNRSSSSTESGKQSSDADRNNSSRSKRSESGWFNSVDPRVISDMIIGLSDGLTVPFALTAGLSSLGDSKLVITGGIAELISGAISMGLGGYLGAKSESDYYHAEVKQEKRKFYDNTALINHEIEDILLEINPNFSDETIVSFIKDLQKTPELMVDFIVRYGRGLDEPAENRQSVSAATIGGGYFVGGLVPLLPYFFVSEVGTGLIWSIVIMAITLFWFGYFKTQVSMSNNCTLQKKISEGFQMVAVGGIAAGSAWFFVRILG
ncbi:hypothetical protein HG536_0H02020 [Torulaspora globosa]|uniref:Protein CCC1 n=1 Tax=Torulaspora globosa TaxID=48254 RepID=A0A7G3ZMU1_9SACH|nr:uncharacterized protein HG536_0H02020 [Torulaspora globosa]QLL34827.1 hypothetical protein HG536_0H02020 [Torulaspora globosa]